MGAEPFNEPRIEGQSAALLVTIEPVTEPTAESTQAPADPSMDIGAE